MGHNAETVMDRKAAFGSWEIHARDLLLLLASRKRILLLAALLLGIGALSLGSFKGRISAELRQERGPLWAAQNRSDFNSAPGAAPFVETIDLRDAAVLILADPGYASTQGMCVAENRYVIVGRYRTDGSKDLMVYDMLEKTVRSSNVFMKTDPGAPDRGRNVDLGHINGLAYCDGYLYVPRDNDILRLSFDDDCAISYDSTVYIPEEWVGSAANMACRDGEFYWTAASGRGGIGGEFFVYRSENFNSTGIAFCSNFGGLVDTASLTQQGMAYDGSYLYFPFSGAFYAPSAEGEPTYQRAVRNTEKIIITRPDGEIVRVLSFSRGSYGEIEDCDLITVKGNTYLLISCNQNDRNVAAVYAVPLFQQTVPSAVLERTNIEGSLYSDGELVVYCDNTACYANGVYNPLKSNPFASGLKNDRFTSLNAAMLFVKRLGCPATLYITGQYGDLSFENLPTGINMVFENAKVRSLSFKQCPEITLGGKGSAVLGCLKAEKSIVLAAPGISLVRAENGIARPLELRDTILTGSFEEIRGYSVSSLNERSIVNVSCRSGALPDGLNSVGSTSASANESRPAEASGNTQVFTMRYYGGAVETTTARNGKNVMLNLTVSINGEKFKAGETAFEGLLPEEYWPAADVVVPAVLSESETGASPVGACSVRISSGGVITVYTSAATPLSAGYILATAAYLVE